MTRAWRLLGLLALALPAPGVAQRPAERRCQLEVLNVDREGVRQAFQTSENYFAGGDVRLRCRSQPVFLAGDSLESYTAQIVRLLGSAQYRDEDIDVTADSLFYTKADERLQLRGNVVVVNRLNGSTLEGPWVDYLRAVRGIRDSAETVALQRPTVTYQVTRAPQDTVDPAPYVVTGDGMKTRGSSWMVSWGQVLVDRDSLHGRGDSLLYVRSDEDLVTLVGEPATLVRTGEGAFDLAGRHVLLGFAGEDLRSVRAFGSGHVTSAGGDVVGDSVSLAFEEGELATTRAWDRAAGATVLAEGYDVRGDSIAIDTPGERLRELRVFGRGTLLEPVDTSAPAPDSLTAMADSARADTLAPIRNAMTGTRIAARFVDVDSAGVVLTRLVDIVATGSATALFARTVMREGTPSPTINYTRGDTIIVVMKTGDSTGVHEVRAYRGSQPVDGIQLERASLRAGAGRALPGGTPARREEGP
jgi:hypothetical protein